MVIHNHLSPIAFAIGPFVIHWYGIAFATVFLLSEWVVRLMLLREGASKIDTSKFVLFAMLGTVLGARAVHCAFYDPLFYLVNPLKIFAVWEGGLASHGGVIGLIAAIAWTTRNLNPGTLIFLLDRITIPAAFGGSVVRIANYVNSEILGRPTSSDYGVIFDAVDQIARHPVQLYEALAYFTLGSILFALYLLPSFSRSPGRLTGIFLLGIFSARIFLEKYKVPQASYEDSFGISVGQLLSIPFIALGLLLLLRAFNCANPANRNA
jgi:phosphatidylglycerol:prolipoprotein diacylglycerol transferase